MFITSTGLFGSLKKVLTFMATAIFTAMHPQQKSPPSSGRDTSIFTDKP